MARKIDVNELAEFSSEEVVKKLLVMGENYKVAFICLEEGQEIPVHPESYEVAFFVVSGRGIFTLDGEAMEMGPGSITYQREGLRGMKALERLTLLGITEKH